MVSAVERLFKYLKTLYPIYGCPWWFVENLSFGYEAIERSQSNHLQLGWNCNVGIHHLGRIKNVGGEFPILSQTQLMLLKGRWEKSYKDGPQYRKYCEPG